MVDDDEIRRFNLMRENKKGQEFSRMGIQDVLYRLMNYTKYDTLLRALCDGVNPPIVKLARGKYMFAKEPVFKDRLQTCWDRYTEFKNLQKQKTDKVMSGEKPVVFPSVSLCIKVLKEHGYRIQKAVTTWEEV